MKCLVTGSNGFVGSALVSELKRKNHQVTCYDRSTNTPANFAGFDVVIHLAAKVHDMHGTDFEPYQQGNVELTQHLVAQAVEAKVAHFIFLSSIKVNGEERIKPYNEVEVPCPHDHYGKSKWLAEQSIKQLCSGSTTAYTIIRPPLIYGRGVKANFQKLAKLVSLPIPLPFASLQNRRSLLSLENLVHFLIHILHHPQAFNQTFFISDGADVSTPELMRLMKKSFAGLALIVPFPVFLLKSFFALMGKEAIFSRLAGNLCVDISKTKKQVDWNPPYTLQQGLDFMSQKL